MSGNKRIKLIPRAPINKRIFDALSNHLVLFPTSLAGIVYGYARRNQSCEYILTPELLGKQPADEIANTPLHVWTQAVRAAGWQLWLNWGDVLREEGEAYRNHGRMFWIDGEAIDFDTSVYSYGAQYEWMTCNRVGSARYWMHTATGHVSVVYLDVKGYKVEKVEDRSVGASAKYVATLTATGSDTWYLIANSKQQVEKFMSTDYCRYGTSPRYPVPPTTRAVAFYDFPDSEDRSKYPLKQLVDIREWSW